MHLVLRLILIYFVPSIFGLMAAAILIFSYLKLGVVVQLEPVWLETARLVVLFMAGIFCAALFYNFSTLAKSNKTIVALLLCLWALFHGINVESQFLSYLGFGCCEEQKASLLNVIDSAINPFFPFVSFER